MAEAVIISVIVPVFNGEKYLSNCLDSICAQTFTDFELICVDDGSLDRSPEILSEYADKDPRIRVIHQENKGCSLARNTGLASAQGKYLVFWDADDWFYPEALEKMYLKCEEDDADICVCNGTTYLEEAEKEIPSAVYLRKSLLPAKRPFSRDDIPDHILDFTVSTVWNKMYRRSFLEENGLRFSDYRTGEDANFLVKALCLAGRITVSEERLVCYRSGQAESLSMQWFDGKTPIDAWIEAADFLKAHQIMPERSFANRAWSSMLGVLRKAASVWELFSKAAETLKNGALERMCVTEREEGYYYEQWKEECLYHLLHDSTEDFLCYYLRVTFLKLREASGQSRAASLKIADLYQENSGLQEKVEKLRDQRQQLGSRLRDTDIRKKELEKENKGLVEKTEELRSIRKDLSDQLKASEKQNQKLLEKTEALRSQRKEIGSQLHDTKAELSRAEKNNQVLREQNQKIKDSVSYKIGRIITWLPRKIMGLFRK